MVNRYDEPLPGTGTILKPVGPESDQGKGPKGNREVLLGDVVHATNRPLDQFLRVTLLAYGTLS